MNKILSFGELLLRICPDAGGQWLQDNQLPFYVGGAEANVATALAQWGLPSAYLTALPENFLSEQLVGYLRGRGVQTDAIVYQGERLGLYYLPKGKDLKNAGVIYDRAHSAFATLQPGTIDWDQVLAGVSWFHFSAICPAITRNVAQVCAEALEAASQRNITISLDLNYRSKLWKYGQDPVQVMPGLAQHCNLIMGNIWAANTMLGIGLDEKRIAGLDKDSLLAQARRSSEEMGQQFPKCKAVANTFRFDQGAGIRYFTTLFTEGELHQSHEYQLDHILDKVGSGDCFMAGLIYGFSQGLAPADTLEFATAAAVNKLFILSDATTSTVADIEQTLHAHAR